MTADEIANIIEGAAARHGVPTDALMAIANLESSGNIGAENPRSSASGLFQFVDSTAREYGLTGNKRNDPAAQADAAAKMMATNARSLERTLGRPANAGELYLAHQQGLTGARALLTNPGRPAVDVLTGVYGDRNRAAQAVRLNGGNLNQSAGQFAGQWVNKANQRASLIPPGSVPNVVGTQTDTTRQTRDVPSPRPRPQQRPDIVQALTPRMIPQGVNYPFLPPMTNTSVTRGFGSLTPNAVQETMPSEIPQTALLPNTRPANVPLPRPRPGMPVVPYDRGETIATVATPQRQRLPELPPAGTPRMADVPWPRPRPVTPSDVASVPYGQGQRVASIPTSGVGLPPATRSVPSVPVPAAPAMGMTTDRGAMPTRSAFLSEFGLANPRETVATPLPTTAIPGPSRVGTNERLGPSIPVASATAAGLGQLFPPTPYYDVGTALDVVPNAVPRLPIGPGLPPPPVPRPLRSGVNVQMPTPMGRRPTLPMPRANPNALRVTVNGAGSYTAPQRAPTPTREQMLAAIRARSRGPTAFGHGGTIDGAVQPIGTLSGRR